MIVIWDEMTTYLFLALSILGLNLLSTATDAFLAEYVEGWITFEVLICDLTLDHSGADLLLELRVITKTHHLVFSGIQ